MLSRLFCFFTRRYMSILISGLPIRYIFSRMLFYTKLSPLLLATHWMLFETRVTATPDKCRAINDSCRNITIIAAVDVDHCVQLLAAFDCIRCFVTSTRADEFANLYLSQSQHTFHPRVMYIFHLTTSWSVARNNNRSRYISGVFELDKRFLKVCVEFITSNILRSICKDAHVKSEIIINRFLKFR